MDSKWLKISVARIIEFLFAMIILGILVIIMTPQFKKTSTVLKVLTEKDYPAVSDGKTIYSLYNFPSADEFEESPFYSMVWIGESAWTEKRFLLVQAKQLHRKYGCIPYLIEAKKEVEKKYNIITEKFAQIAPSSSSLAYTDSLVLEVKPK